MQQMGVAIKQDVAGLQRPITQYVANLQRTGKGMVSILIDAVGGHTQKIWRSWDSRYRVK
jgi:hypothetical protein